MVWKAYLESVQDNIAAPDDTINIQIRYENANGKKIVKQYVLHAGVNATRADLRVIVGEELDRLDLKDPNKTDLEALIGLQIKRPAEA